MSTVLDSGVFLAFMAPADRHHEVAKRFLQESRRGKHGTLLAPDAVYVEVMNYLRRKPARRSTCEAMLALRQHPGSPVRWMATDEAILQKAEMAYFRHFEVGLSMTDALVLAVAHEARAKVATFDAGFKGLVDLAL